MQLAFAYSKYLRWSNKEEKVFAYNCKEHQSTLVYCRSILFSVLSTTHIQNTHIPLYVLKGTCKYCRKKCCLILDCCKKGLSKLQCRSQWCPTLVETLAVLCCVYSCLCLVFLSHPCLNLACTNFLCLEIQEGLGRLSQVIKCHRSVTGWRASD